MCTGATTNTRTVDNNIKGKKKKTHALGMQEYWQLVIEQLISEEHTSELQSLLLQAQRMRWAVSCFISIF